MLADIAEIFIRLGLTAAPDDLTDANGDLIWPQGKTSAGYGVFNGEYVHRLVCEWANGPIPDDWTVDHVWEAGCRSRACFLPAHLEAVTSGENTRRVFAALRSTGRRQCGHPWGNGNDRANGQCKVCHRVSEARRRAPWMAARKTRIEERARLILELRAKGLSRPETAKNVGCSVETVRRTERTLSV